MLTPVKCPKCGLAMERGTLCAGGQGIIWTERRNRWGCQVWPGDVPLQKHLRTRSQTVAYICRRCRTVLVEY